MLTISYRFHKLKSFCVQLSLVTGTYQGRHQPHGMLGFLDHFIYQTLGGKENFKIEIIPSKYRSEIDGKCNKHSQ